MVVASERNHRSVQVPVVPLSLPRGRELEHLRSVGLLLSASGTARATSSHSCSGHQRLGCGRGGVARADHRFVCHALGVVLGWRRFAGAGGAVLSFVASLRAPCPNLAVYPDAREASHLGRISVVARR